MNQSISVFPFTLTINTNKYWLLGSPGQLLKARKDGHLFNEKEFNVSKLFLKYTSKIFLALSFMLIFFYPPFKAFPSFSFYLYLWFAKFCLTMKIKKMTNQTRNRKWRGHERTEISSAPFFSCTACIPRMLRSWSFPYCWWIHWNNRIKLAFVAAKGKPEIKSENQQRRLCQFANQITIRRRSTGNGHLL